MITFIVAVNSLAIGEPAKLLGQIKASNLSILLISKQWFEDEKGDSDISKLPFPSFPLLVLKSWCGYLLLGRFQNWFFQIYEKTQMLKLKNHFFLPIKIFSKVVSTKRISSRYFTRRMFNRLSIGIFNNFEKILGAGPNIKQRQRNWWRFPNQANLTKFLEVTHSGTEK